MLELFHELADVAHVSAFQQPALHRLALDLGFTHAHTPNPRSVTLVRPERHRPPGWLRAGASIGFAPVRGKRDRQSVVEHTFSGSVGAVGVTGASWCSDKRLVRWKQPGPDGWSMPLDFPISAVATPSPLAGGSSAPQHTAKGPSHVLPPVLNLCKNQRRSNRLRSRPVS